MKYNLKFILRTQKTKPNGLAPVALRIYLGHKVGTKYEYITTNIWLSPEHWDETKEAVKRACPNHQSHNAILGQLKSKVDKVLWAEDMNGNTAPENIKRLLSGNGQGQQDFFSFARKFLENHNTINDASRIKYHIFINDFQNFVGKTLLPISKVTTDLLKGYISHLVQRNMKPASITSYLVVLKMVMKSAVSRGLVKENVYHASEIKVTRKSDPHAIKFLSEEQVKRLFALPENPKPTKQVYLDMFIFSLLTGGLRWSDVVDLRWENLHTDKEGRTILRKQIVKMGRKNYPLAVSPKAMEILTKYKVDENASGFVFHKALNINEADYLSGVIGRQRQAGNAATMCNKYLKKISAELELDFNLHFHCSRHTFATLALRTMRIELVSKILGHSSIKMTERYAKIMEDDALKGQDDFMHKMDSLLGA